MVSLTETDAGGLNVRYSVKRGASQSYTTQPLLLLIVDRKYQKPVTLEAVTKQHRSTIL